MGLIGLVEPAAAQKLYEGVVLEKLTDNGRSWVQSWAPHGDWFAYVFEISETQTQLRVRTIDGEEDDIVSPVGYVFHVEWSWAGDKIAYLFANSQDEESQAGAFVYDLTTKKTVQISQPYTLSSMTRSFRRRGSSGRSSSFGSYQRSAGDDRPTFGADGPRWSPDDKLLAYKVQIGEERREEVWVAEAESGKRDRLLSQRGQVSSPYWSPAMPPRLVVQVTAAGENNDIVTVNPDNTELIMLTNIGSESIRNDDASWSYDGTKILYISDAEMTKDEQNKYRSDVFIINPDGTGRVNLTKASSPSTEEQLGLFGARWSWDGRWAIGGGSRYDQQENSISTRWLLDPVGETYEVIVTSFPQKTGEYERNRSWQWSYDSTKVAMWAIRSRVKNWGADAQYEDQRTVLRLYDVKKREMIDIVEFSQDRDRKEVAGQVTWAPDNRSLLITIDELISATEGISQPDIFRLHLPETLIDPSASEHIGPPVPLGGPRRVVASADPGEPAEQPTESLDAPPAPVEDEILSLPATNANSGEMTGTGDYTLIITPQHITVDEALETMPSSYGSFLTPNPSRNFMLFQGPMAMYEEILHVLEKVDTPVKHIMVDLLALEMSDEIDRQLGLNWGFKTARTSLRSSPGSMDFLTGGVIADVPSEFFLDIAALEKEGDVTILANPRNVATNGKESTIQIRTTLNFFFQEGFDFQGRPIVKKSDITADTVGRIIPTLLADGRIHMVIDVTVATFTFTPEDDLPELTTRQSTTEVTVAQGETIIIGGLRQQDLQYTRTRTALLGRIPIIGNLFKRTEREIRHSVLTILITPSVLTEEDPIPAWTTLSGEGNEIVPIMDDEAMGRTEKKDTTYKPGWFGRAMRGVFGRTGEKPSDDPNEQSSTDPNPNLIPMKNGLPTRSITGGR